MPNPQRSASIVYGFLALFSLPFAGVGIGMAIWLGSTLFTWHSAQSWVEVPAHILRTEMEVHRNTNSRHGATTYKTTTEYAYEYHGQKYTGHDVGLSGISDNLGSFQRDSYQELSKYKKAGKPFRCYVNPAWPEQALLYRDLRWEMLTLQTAFVLVFGGAGLGVMIFAVIGFRNAQACAALVAAHPGMPWMWKPDWAEGRITSSSKTTMVVAIIGAIFWNLISTPLLVLVLPGEIRKGNSIAWIFLLFPAIGLGLLAWAVILILRWRKFGESVFRMASVPGVIGGQLAGAVQTSAKIRPTDGFHLTLSCVRQITTGSGKNSSTRENKLWEKMQTVDHELLDAMAEISGIPVVFQIPSDCQPTDETNANDKTIWQLKVTAKEPGFNYSETFEVPVFKTLE